MKKFKFKKPNKKNLRNYLMFITILLVVLSPFISAYFTENPKEISYTTFTNMLKEHKVKEVTIIRGTGSVVVTDKSKKEFQTENPRHETFKKELLESNVRVVEYTPIDFAGYLRNLIIIGLIIAFFIWMQKKQMNIGASSKTSSTVKINSDLSFKDVAGNKGVIKDLKLLVDFLKDPKRYDKLGATMPKGVLLYGPPGTGKTLIAKALAGEAKVPFFSISGSDFIEKFVGVGASRVRDLFENARKHSPCIIFIDELDAIGGKREGAHAENTQTINALLSEMDGYSSANGVLVIATTNRIESLDDALVRAGRFDKHVMVPLPQTPQEREEIIEIHAKGKTFADDFSISHLAKQTLGFSGADIKSLLNEALLISIQDGKEAIDMQSIDKAMFKIILKGHPNEDMPRSKEEIRLVAYHEAGHALVAKLITDISVPKVTIISSTSGAGGVTFYSPSKSGLHTIEELKNEIKRAYGGRVAEYLLFNDNQKVTTGAHNDILQATKKIKEMISSYGMDESIGMLNLNVLKANESSILERATKLSSQLYDETVQLLTDNRLLLDAIAEALIEKETLSEEELDAIISEHSDVRIAS
ncbi:ATP-dependent metallopeptidase FtsH/Yme1/Tma family protein [Bacillus thuringiensis]|uniref:ATP-dependent metallopeptidase FtsH/Yme1/Tma family protein n=1 Tax=Bacillus thuringiensis TaxID=1428 RepID=UPI00294D35A6|nr:ATP-dependent metallopeptidase FtsH/Yme1/Tma family protein [Bacillus thuringiensis]MDV6355527.1 ATP-dependent zinc metalloprotease FtsH [Bacillus thuringiensis]